MRIARLVIALVAGCFLALGMAAPSFAATPGLAAVAQPEPSGDPSEEPSVEPTDDPSEEPAPPFDATITPNPFQAGDRLTLTTTGCSEVPTVEDVDGLFTGPLTLAEIGELQHRGSAVTKSSLPTNKVFHLIVTCGEDTITFTTSAGKKAKKQTGGVTPVGGVDTGDGTTVQAGNSVLVPTLVSGAVVVLAAAALGLAYRRRKAQEDA